MDARELAPLAQNIIDASIPFLQEVEGDEDFTITLHFKRRSGTIDVDANLSVKGARKRR